MMHSHRVEHRRVGGKSEMVGELVVFNEDDGSVSQTALLTCHNLLTVTARHSKPVRII